MVRKTLAAAALVYFLAPGASPAAGQSLDDWPDQEFLDTAVAYPLATVEDTCLTRLTVDANVTVRQARCRVQSLRALGSIGGRQWYVAQYRRSALVEWRQPADSTDWDEVVLLRTAPGGDSLIPAWHIQADRTYEFLRDVQAKVRPEGLLIELLICVNGTGGCARSYFLDAGSGLRYIHIPFAKDLQARLAKGQWLHKGMTLDMETLRGTWPVAKPGDLNCCPSLMYDYAVRLEGTDLVLVSAALHPMRNERP